MCLYTNWRISRITLWPKRCYKVLVVDNYGGILTSYRYHPVTFDKTLRAKGRIDRESTGLDSGKYKISAGMFHTWVTFQDAKEDAHWNANFTYIDGLRPASIIVVRAIIPAFTRYYYGTFIRKYSICYCSKRIRYNRKDIVYRIDFKSHTTNEEN